jgi:excisionase family DNA binding protein
LCCFYHFCHLEFGIICKYVMGVVKLPLIPGRDPMPADADSEFVSTREAADMLGVALRTVQLWVENGSLQAWKTAGGHRRIVRASVAQMLRARDTVVSRALAAADFRMLVVEDDARLRRLFEIEVPRWTPPVKLDVAKDGFEGLLKAGAQHPHLILADLQMPGMDGFRMIEAMRADRSIAGEIIVMTALDPAAIAEHGGLAPDITVLQKPVRMAQIRSLVDERRERLVRAAS